MRQKPQTTVDEFSESYWILPEVNIEPATVDKVVVNHDVLVELGRIAGRPLLKLGEKYFWLDHEPAVPSEVIAVPLNEDIEDDVSILMAKRQAAREMVQGGLIEPPEG